MMVNIFSTWGAEQTLAAAAPRAGNCTPTEDENADADLEDAWL